MSDIPASRASSSIGKGASRASVVRAVLAAELRQLLRDRRALFTAVVLPALLYPLLFWFTGGLEKVSEETLAAREVLVAVDLSRADEALATRVRELLGQRTPIQLVDVDAKSLFELEANTALEDDVRARRLRALVADVGGGSAHLVLTARPHPSAPRRTLFELYFEVKDDVAREARERAEDALHELEEALVAVRREELLGDDPALGLDLESVDVATAGQTGGAALGRALPFLAVIVLVSGGAYAALAVFAGERESGTLETLLVQPVPPEAVAWGKYLAVLAAGLVTLLCNLVSLVGTVALGVGTLPGLDAGADSVELGRMVAGLAYLPGCVLLCAILCLVCGRARSFREGQQTILPITLAAVVPSAIVFQPDVELSFLWAVIPFSGPALAMRDALRGSLALWPFVVMVLSHAAWSWLALARLGSILDAERVFSTADTEAEASLREASARHALRWGLFSVLTIYVVGGWLQAWSPEYGLALTLWIVVPLLALGCASRAARRARVPLAGELGLRLPSARHVLGGLLLVPGLVWLAARWLPLQQRLLPLPESLLQDTSIGEMFDAMPTWKLAFLLALTPAVCEELLFRGALLSSLRRDLSATKVVLWQALFFAAAHASVYRIVPTAFLGAVLAGVTLRARSVLPAMLVHAGYNGVIVLSQSERVGWMEAPWFEWAALAAPVGVVLLASRPRS